MTPQDKHISESIPTPVKTDDGFRMMSGREIYNQISLTGINRAIIDSLTAFIVGESQIKRIGNSPWPEIPPDAMCEHYLVDGSFAIRIMSEEEMAKNEKLDNNYEFLTDLKEVHKRLVVQILRDSNGTPTNVSRVWQRTEIDWVVRDVENYGAKAQRVLATERYPLEAFLPYPGGYGIIFWNQYTYQRIEEIEYNIRKQTGKASLQFFLTGYLGNVEQARTEIAGGGEIIHLPGNPTITRAASSGTTDQLERDGLKLMALFLKNTHQVEISETSTMSGVSRRLAMTPMLHYIKLVQVKLQEIYETIGYNMKTQGLRITTPDERSAELDFLQRGLHEGIIDQETYNTSAEALYN